MDESKLINFIEEIKRLILGGTPKKEDESLSEFEYARKHSKTRSMAQE
jgi:hypothetical protein|tara:strand:+ start:3414 stop:3557 length:144 start_codon:yes stop_codon:yes gene_type:complete